MTKKGKILHVVFEYSGFSAFYPEGCLLGKNQKVIFQSVLLGDLIRTNYHSRIRKRLTDGGTGEVAFGSKSNILALLNLGLLNKEAGVEQIIPA